MRDILFRGLASAEGFVYGHLFTEELPSGHTYAAIVKEIDGRWRNVVVYENTVGQFTGLTDANGVKIFDGDIIDDAFNIGQLRLVKYSVEHAAFMMEFARGPLSSSGYSSPISISTESITGGKVIGNIHQHQHLLEK